MRSPVTLAICLATAALPVGSLAQTVIYETGFEAPVFHTGPVGHSYLATDGQDGWFAAPRAAYSAAPSPWVTVTDQFARTGSQSLKFDMNASTFGAPGAWRELAPGSVTLNSPTDPFRLSMDLYLDQAPGSDLPWNLYLSAGFVISLGLTIQPNNTLTYGHTYMNMGATFTPGFDMKNTWLNVVLERDPTDYTALLLSISGRGQTWQQQLSSPGGAMNYVGFGASMPTFPVAPYGVAYMDNFQLGYNLTPVPEPAGHALMLVAVGGLLLRRQRTR
jgi:hypothetical protein